MLAQQHSGTGEQRSFQLDDGSLIQLNSNSAVDSVFDTHRRLIILRRGEIIVNVGADERSTQPRPFWVQTRDGVIRAQSPRFLARERDDGTLLAFQGRAVTVFPGYRRPVTDSVGGSVGGSVATRTPLLFTSGGVREFRDNGLDTCYC
ncbi:FecR domain-containing protein [Pseudomonas sp. MWU16-30317]|uniref:FecR domain-containing protein n=1 Tax=Pseudomonas sp. MWU16-30317 TaxID=2878095 RepID=UPI001CFBDC3F|nr:FecR domain-containing protein [Pseudomonas sp. MWU16-30317]